MLTERFWSKVEKTDGCWLWRGARRRDGYGLFWNRHEHRWDRAHRVAFEDANGPIPDGLSLLHSCDQPPCVRPAHLRTGTQAENLADMTAKGRRSQGERHPWHGQNQSGESNHAARLTVGQVREIRALGRAGYDHREIAEKFHVHFGTIGYVMRGQTWKGIEAGEDVPPVTRLRYGPKLNATIAQTIRCEYTGARGDLTRLALLYGVSIPTVRAILDGRSYADS